MCVYYQNIKMSTYFESIFNYYLTHIVQCHNKFYKKNNNNLVVAPSLSATQLLKKKKFDLFFTKKEKHTYTHTHKIDC